MDGAKGLEPSFVESRLLLNLDGTSDRSLTIGCAGSLHTFSRIDLRPQPPADDAAAFSVELTGARGGHSGADIHRGRANAITGLCRVLSRALESAEFGLAELKGGVSRNAIPREALAVVAVDPAVEAAFRAAAENAFEDLRERHRGLGDELRLVIDPVEPYAAAGTETTRRALDLAAVHPTGVLAVSPQNPGKIETSASLNIAVTEGDVLRLDCMIRSANPVALEDVAAGIVAAGRLAGAEVELLRSYPPWRPDPDSRLLTVAQRTFERVNGEPPHLEVVHGGLECAVIASRLPGVEMLALGPEIVGPHAPGERVSIASTQRFYGFLGALLDDLSI
jgi:dipeptidase D